MPGAFVPEDADCIVGSRLYKLGGSLCVPAVNAQRTTRAREGVVLEIWDSAGNRGVGEASPLLGHSAETLAECVSVLTDIHQKIVGCDHEGWPAIPALSAVPAACFAWESALCDLLARRRHVSVAQLFGGTSARIARNAVVSDLAQAEAAWARGIRTLKVKVGHPKKEESEELHFLASLRQRFGDALTLRLDANGAWSIPEAQKQMQRLASIGPQYVEQPVSADSLPLLGRCAAPWAADESLASADVARTLLDCPLCVAFVLKPALLGFRRSRDLAMCAQSKGKGVVITHALDGPIGLAAACELALSLPLVPWSCGLDLHPGLSAWPSVPIPQLVQSPAFVSPSESLGLGFAFGGLPWT